ncbi:helix-turn-helix domain-containing protein [Oxalobacteraceae bacterium OM1]|nr:helix-turn-helix domain-containing protein [Oxalobacteraceae bacterium OM1]
MKNIVILALDGMMDSGLAITLDVLRTAAALQSNSGLDIRVAGYGKSVGAGSGMQLACDLRLGDPAKWPVRPDWIVVPGMGMTSDAAASERLQQRDARAAMALLRSLPGSTQLGVACSSVFLLAEAGLLAGCRATTTWWLASVFRRRYPDVRLDETRMLVRDGRFLTAGSAFAQLDLMLAIVGELGGVSAAELCARYLLIDQRPSQARYMVPTHTQQADPTVAAAERWIDAHLAEPVSIAELAAALALSPKTLSRRVHAAVGISPLKLVQRRRLLQAAHLLQTTRLSIDRIASRVGYQDGTALRKIIKREFGTTPAALRSHGQ